LMPFNFEWNTLDAIHGTYTIIANVSIIGQTDTDPGDNTFFDGEVHVKIPGDIDGDGDVDWVGFGDFATAYGSKGPPQVLTPDPKYDLQADLDLDGDVDWVDFGTFATHYGENI